VRLDAAALARPPDHRDLPLSQTPAAHEPTSATKDSTVCGTSDPPAPGAASGCWTTLHPRRAAHRVGCGNDSHAAARIWPQRHSPAARSAERSLSRGCTHQPRPIGGRAPELRIRTGCSPRKQACVPVRPPGLLACAVAAPGRVRSARRNVTSRPNPGPYTRGERPEASGGGSLGSNACFVGCRVSSAVDGGESAAAGGCRSSGSCR
jgi:hypothetical protein